MTDSPVMTTTKPAEPSASKNTKKNPLSDGQGALAAALISPTMAVILFVVGIPILMSLRESVFRKNEGIDPNTGMVAQGESFVGLQNFTDIFANPTLVQGNWGNIDRLLNSFANTTFFTIVCVVLETILGVAMALIMAKAFKGQGLVRAAILVPWAIPTIVSAKMWGLIFDSDGVMSSTGNSRNGCSARAWGGSRRTAVLMCSASCASAGRVSRNTVDSTCPAIWAMDG